MSHTLLHAAHGLDVLGNKVWLIREKRWAMEVDVYPHGQREESFRSMTGGGTRAFAQAVIDALEKWGWAGPIYGEPCCHRRCSVFARKLARAGYTIRITDQAVIAIK